MKDPDHPEPSASLMRFLRTAQRDVGLIGEVNVRITSDGEMRRLNRDFRGKDKSTDVLSFPAIQNGKTMTAGDIAISAEIARANAKALGHSFEEELKILLLHGLLHLAGYDHESDDGEMSSLEQQLRAKLKLPTGLIERTSAGFGRDAARLVFPVAPSRNRAKTIVTSPSRLRSDFVSRTKTQHAASLRKAKSVAARRSS